MSAYLNGHAASAKRALHEIQERENPGLVNALEKYGACVPDNGKIQAVKELKNRVR